MRMTRHELLDLLELLAVTAEHEIDCADFLERAALYLDRLAAGGGPRTFEDVLQHMRVCPECLEEFEALVRATEPSHRQREP